MKEGRRLKEEIIKFVQDSPEDVNTKIAVFIAGMQAQKNLSGNGFTIINNNSDKKKRG